MCQRAFDGLRVTVRARPADRSFGSQAASLRSSWRWVRGNIAESATCWDAILVLRADVAFKQPLPLPPAWTPLASSVHVPHPTPGVSATTHQKVGDIFFLIPRDLFERMRYVLETKDELGMQDGLHDLADWLPRGRMRYWVPSQHETNTNIAPNPLFFQTGRDGAVDCAGDAVRPDEPCAARGPWSTGGGWAKIVTWGDDGDAVWASQLAAARRHAARVSDVLGSHPYCIQSTDHVCR